MFFALLRLSQTLATNGFRRACGRYWLTIFLVHMFVYRGLMLGLIGRNFAVVEAVAPHFWVGLGVLFVTVVTSLWVAKAITRRPRVNALVFPRDWYGWRAALCGLEP